MKKLLSILLIMMIFSIPCFATNAAKLIDNISSFMKNQGFNLEKEQLMLGIKYFEYKYDKIEIKGVVSVRYLNIMGDLIEKPIICGLFWEKNQKNPKMWSFCTQNPQEFKEIVQKLVILRKSMYD